MVKQVTDMETWLHDTDGRIFWNVLIKYLPNQPRSFDTSDDPGYWTNGDSILCPSEADKDFLVQFLSDTFHNYKVSIIDGYYDPFEDYENKECDDCTGFWYVTIV